MLSGIACRAANVRPYIMPFPGAPTDTVLGDPANIVRHVAGLLGRERIEIQMMSAEEGYVETRWFDVRTHDTTGTLTWGPDARLRFWVDPIGNGEAQVVGEAVGRRSVDPSLPAREREILLTADEVGRTILIRVMTAVRERFK